MEFSEVLQTMFYFSFGWNNNQLWWDSNILAKFDYKGVPVNIIDSVRSIFSGNHGGELYIYWSEVNVRSSGELPIRERHIIIGGRFVIVLDTETLERDGSGSWGTHIGCSGREAIWSNIWELCLFGWSMGLFSLNIQWEILCGCRERILAFNVHEGVKGYFNF